MTKDIVPIDKEQARKAAILKAIGLDRVPAEQREIALAIADRYGLDLMLKHLVLVDGRPYITRDGLLHVAHRSGALDGIEVTDPELVDLEGVGKFWRARCSVYRKDMGRPFVYAGRYPAKGGNQRFAPEMAVKVAEVMALRRAFDVSAPVIEERWDVDVTAAEPEVTITEQIAAKRRTISGPAAPSVEDESVADSPPTTAGDVQPGAAGEADAEPVHGSADEPPHPASQAGAPADTSAALPSDPDLGEPTPAPSRGAARAAAPTQRCPTFHATLGACQQVEGHDGPHRSKDEEAW
jgi:hypothetical protein